MKRMLDNIFAIGVFLFMLMGTGIVLMQAIGVVMLDGSLALAAKNYLSKPTYAAAAISGVLAFAGFYIHGWKSDD